MLRGNHDELTNNIYEALGYSIIPEFIQNINGQRILFSHHPDEHRIDQWDINIHGHIHNHPPRGVEYINVSVEVIGYRPIRLQEVLIQHVS